MDSCQRHTYISRDRGACDTSIASNVMNPSTCNVASGMDVLASVFFECVRCLCRLECN